MASVVTASFFKFSITSSTFYCIPSYRFSCSKCCLWISLFGGVAVMPHKYIFSKKSAVLNTEPILCKLRTSSKTIIIGVFCWAFKIEQIFALIRCFLVFSFFFGVCSNKKASGIGSFYYMSLKFSSLKHHQLMTPFIVEYFSRLSVSVWSYCHCFSERSNSVSSIFYTNNTFAPGQLALLEVGTVQPHEPWVFVIIKVGTIVSKTNSRCPSALCAIVP
jgi:hypothetical protein